MPAALLRLRNSSSVLRVDYTASSSFMPACIRSTDCVFSQLSQPRANESFASRALSAENVVREHSYATWCLEGDT